MISVKVLGRLVLGAVFLKGVFLALCVSGFSQGWMIQPIYAQSKEENVRKGVLQGKADIDLQELDINEKVKAVLLVKARQLREKERALSQKEKDLDLIKNELQKRTEELRSLQESLVGPIAKARKAEQAKFDHLVGVYSSMDPTKAAVLLSKMDEDTVVRIFSSMKSKRVAKVMSLMDPEKAARLSSKLTGRPAS